jgi:hypothetical protein
MFGIPVHRSEIRNSTWINIVDQHKDFGKPFEDARLLDRVHSALGAPAFPALAIQV